MTPTDHQDEPAERPAEAVPDAPASPSGPDVRPESSAQTKSLQDILTEVRKMSGDLRRYVTSQQFSDFSIWYLFNLRNIKVSVLKSLPGSRDLFRLSSFMAGG